MITKERIKKINTLDSEKLLVVLINLLRMISKVETKFVDKVKQYKVESTKNLKHKRHKKQVKGSFDELYIDFIDTYRNSGISELILNELLEYLKLENDRLSRDIIEGYCMSADIFWDIDKLKEHLIWWVIELERQKSLDSSLKELK